MLHIFKADSSFSSGVEHVHVNGRFKDLWNFGFRAKKKVRFKDSKIHANFLELRFFMKLETARFKIQRFTWNFKIQESRLMKLETLRFKDSLKLETLRFKDSLKLKTSIQCARTLTFAIFLNMTTIP